MPGCLDSGNAQKSNWGRRGWGAGPQPSGGGVGAAAIRTPSSGPITFCMFSHKSTVMVQACF